MSKRLQSVEVTIESVNGQAMKLLKSNPSEYVRTTHRPLPFGLSSRSMTTEKSNG